MNPAELRRHVKKQVELTFSDGEVVIAKLLWVDIEEHNDIGYELVQVLKLGGGKYDKPAAFVAPLRDLVGWKVLD